MEAISLRNAIALIPKYATTNPYEIELNQPNWTNIKLKAANKSKSPNSKIIIFYINDQYFIKILITLFFMITRVTETIIKISFPDLDTCNAYFIEDKNILIDTGSIAAKRALPKFLPIASEDINFLFLTHLHYDHIGCFDLFPESTILTSQAAIDLLKKNPGEAIHDMETTLLAGNGTFHPMSYEEAAPRLKDMGFTIINTPGHTGGSVCILYKADGKEILFSGDTIFDPEMKTVGRTDLPTSNPRDLDITLRKLETISYDILCPGHGKITKL